MLSIDPKIIVIKYIIHKIGNRKNIIEKYIIILYIAFIIFMLQIYKLFLNMFLLLLKL